MVVIVFIVITVNTRMLFFEEDWYSFSCLKIKREIKQLLSLHKNWCKGKRNNFTFLLSLVLYIYILNLTVDAKLINSNLSKCMQKVLMFEKIYRFLIFKKNFWPPLHDSLNVFNAYPNLCFNIMLEWYTIIIWKML